jgi:predicted enzyme related to lactoylglutathione lyase
MPNVENHKPGAFCWFELATSDQDGAKKFYTSLFGWNVNDSPMGPDDYYSMFQLQGREVAAGYTMRREQREQGVPPHWMVYIAVDSADEVARRTPELGGKVFAPAFDVMDYGRMTVLADPTHAVFSVWQPKSHKGVGIAGVDGTICWADLSTSDPEKAKQFYSGLFGWKIAAAEHDPSGYLHIQNGEDFIGGIPSAGNRDPQVPSHWLIYVLTSDVDAAASKANELGGQYLVRPQDIPKTGRMAILRDPQGAVFALFQPERR